MPRLVKRYIARLLSVKSTGVKDEAEWSWREIFVGVRGVMNIYESVNKAPGKYFVYIKNTDNYLRTGQGDMIEEDNIITLSTKNSVYKFQLLSGNLLEGEE